MMIGYHTVGIILRAAADRAGDASGRVELLAAAEVCAALNHKGFEVEHIDDWLLDLLRQIESGRAGGLRPTGMSDER